MRNDVKYFFLRQQSILKQPTDDTIFIQVIS